MIGRACVCTPIEKVHVFVTLVCEGSSSMSSDVQRILRTGIYGSGGYTLPSQGIRHKWWHVIAETCMQPPGINGAHLYSKLTAFWVDTEQYRG